MCGENVFVSFWLIYIVDNNKLFHSFINSRENDGTEREAQGVGRDMSCHFTISFTIYLLVLVIYVLT